MSMSGCELMKVFIFNNSYQKNLNMSGHPSEFGIYLSIIKSNNLHVKNGDDFEFSLKKTKNNSIKIIYDEFFKIN